MLLSRKHNVSSVSEDVRWQLTVTFTFGSLLVKLKECVTVLIQCNNTLQYNKSTCHAFILQAFSRTLYLLLLHAFMLQTRTLPLHLLFSVSYAYVIEMLITLIFGPGIESWWGRDFSAPVQTGPEAHPASYTTGTESLSREVMRPGRGVDHPPHLAPKLKKE